MNADFKHDLLTATHATDCAVHEVMQTLWSGYGKIVRYTLEGSPNSTVVVKHISLQQASAHPRGWNTDLAHQRKVKSYQVETHWYTHWNQRCTDQCKVPQCMGTNATGQNQWIILEDLQPKFPAVRQHITLPEVRACLSWLANFHARFMGQEPAGLWEIGTYWHLATRPNELEKIEQQAVKAKAHLIDERLNQCRYKTIVHGDAKLANFCFSEDGKRVAAVDFQYVGGGCGMKDVAYFLGSCLSGAECETHEDALLNFYFEALKTAVEQTTLEVEFETLAQEWRSMYPLACADFTRFLLGWMPTHNKINGYSRKILEAVLGGLN